MQTYIALLRAVNVGGTGKLAMQDLSRLCSELDFAHVKTYIASGNVIFQSKLSAKQCREKLELALQDYVGKPVGVFIRTPEEIEELISNNPYKEQANNRVVGIFIDAQPESNILSTVRGQQEELIALGSQHIYVLYGEGMASSKLVIPAAKSGTARNMNTILKLASLSRQSPYL
ncbi:DUF1697 domain-containing protein [Undibacterium fentianense]|uniref:DUF1697 domain-containing protein n=1 Tax=Undibacterium fentianense TaxID=2828728 RepID=A0A941E4M8_9BURK|nr:DUF1697 domain-containing protein [Undibacterium fentianense]MBR7800967.1 DUF1697 domain-containing protein [Undibacterium fentianense]